MMDVYIIAISYYATLFIGICGIIITASYLLNKAYTALLNHFKLYNEFVRFVFDRRRKKQADVYTPKINGKEEQK